MKIETKYNIGDTVYFLGDNEIIEREIIGIFIDFYADSDYNTTGIEYVISINSKTEMIESEHKLFPTKQALLDSL